jgi:1-acyl-sn-glycerol-3-phosphate acyltransferase
MVRTLKRLWIWTQFILFRIAHNFMYGLGWFVDRAMIFIVCDFKLVGIENMPTGKTGVLVTGNHISMWDLPMAFRIMPRPFYTMAKTEFLKIPLVGGLARSLGSYPIKRGKPDRQSLQYTIELLKRKQIVLLYPEGHRSDYYGLQEGHSGAAMVALQGEALVVPVAVHGTEFIARKRKGFFSRPRVTMTVGKPYRLNRFNSDGSKASLEDLADVMMLKIAELLPPEYQGYYSSQKVAERQVEKAAREQENRATTRRTIHKIAASKNGASTPEQETHVDDTTGKGL